MYIVEQTYGMTPRGQYPLQLRPRLRIGEIEDLRLELREHIPISQQFDIVSGLFGSSVSARETQRPTTRHRVAWPIDGRWEMKR